MAAKRGGANGVSLINTIKSIIGVDIDNFVPMPSVGNGCREIRIREASGGRHAVVPTGRGLIGTMVMLENSSTTLVNTSTG